MKKSLTNNVECGIIYRCSEQSTYAPLAQLVEHLTPVSYTYLDYKKSYNYNELALSFKPNSEAGLSNKKLFEKNFVFSAE